MPKASLRTVSSSVLHTSYSVFDHRDECEPELGGGGGTNAIV